MERPTDTYAARLAALVSSADSAYGRARIEVYNALPTGALIDVDVLNASQRDALDDLVIAEAELAFFRHSHCEPDRTPQPSLSTSRGV